nr:MAG TPA: hypothetical protein [Caudoviricetes sp.]
MNKIIENILVKVINSITYVIRKLTSLLEVK